MGNRSSIRHLLPLFILSLVGCAMSSKERRDENPVAVEQWLTAQSQSPLVAAAFIQSLLALTEDGQNAALARENAFILARQCGLVTTRRPPPACAFCKPATRQADVPRYLDCLSRRLNCLAPP